jgi:hypothetical protein
MGIFKRGQSPKFSKTKPPAFAGGFDVYKYRVKNLNGLCPHFQF